MTLDAAADDFLEQCARCIVNGEAAPAWPDGLSGVGGENAVQDRIAFHGIALLLVEHPSLLDDWPENLLSVTRSEARMQGMWEISHAQAVATLFEALHDAGITAIAMKGTALAYSLYDDPAIRRRGDTDILIHTHNRDNVRRVMREAGFSPGGDPLALQEEWFFHTGINFNHEIDVHWRINASQALSRALEHDPASQRAIDLPRLSKNAKGMSVLDSILHTCVNRAAHHAYGYPVEDKKLME
ncbi:MAG: nucleotidyltransferase family protein, partial [Marinomonas sp.]